MYVLSGVLPTAIALWNFLWTLFTTPVVATPVLSATKKEVYTFYRKWLMISTLKILL